MLITAKVIVQDVKYIIHVQAIIFCKETTYCSHFKIVKITSLASSFISFISTSENFPK